MSESSKSPKLSLKLIDWLCKPELVEELQGNLLEYHSDVDQSKFSGFKYWFQVFNYLRPSTLKSLKTQNSGPMFIFNPILTLRNLYRHRATSTINILGFSLGLVAIFFLYFHISSELSTDKFHSDKDITYRVLRVGGINGSPYRIGVTSAPYAEALLTDFPSDVSTVTRVAPEQGLVTIGNQKFNERNLIFADANFFEFFSYPLAFGDKRSVLSDINSAVLSKETALKYFGDLNPIGQTIKIDNEYDFIVTGVMDELPSKTHINFNMVLSMGVLESQSWFDGWWNNGLLTYVKVPQKERVKYLHSQFESFMDKYMGEDFAAAGNRIDLELEPLDEVYFNSETRYDIGVIHGNYSSIVTLGIVAIAILFIACFNYVNLSIAQSFTRAKEVGIRKVLGGSKSRLVFQFLTESLMILFFAILISIGLCELTNPLLKSAFGLEVTLNWMDQSVLIFFAVLIFGVILFSGIYPALLLSSFKPISILRGGKLTSGKNVGLRKTLVVAQFAISIFLIVASLFINIQTDFLNNKELGFDREALVIMDLYNGDIRSQSGVLKDRFESNSNILGVTSFSGEPGGFHDASTFQIAGVEGNHRMRTLFTDTDYFDVMDVEVVSGRGFSNEIEADDQMAVLFNEKALEDMGLVATDVIGKRMSMPGWDIQDVPIIGIAADYHFISLKNEIEPLAILTGGFHRKMAVKINMNNANDQLNFIEETYSELVPEFPISYQFLDEHLARLYANEELQKKLFGTFSGLSIFLACLGIFGLASYSAQQRQKELGIRKVLGATAQQIVGLISKEFVLLVLVASAIAIPAAWYFMADWLGAFPYRITIVNHWYVFLIGGLITVVIALVTITFKTYKAAISDPTESIRNE